MYIVANMQYNYITIQNEKLSWRNKFFSELQVLSTFCNFAL